MKITHNDGVFTLIRDDASEELLTKKTSDGYLYMPADVVEATNRRLVSMKLIKEAGTFELTPKAYKAPRVLGPRTKVSIEEVLSPEELKKYQEAKAAFEMWEVTIKERIKEKQNRPLTELEKAEREYEKALARLEALRK